MFKVSAATVAAFGFFIAIALGFLFFYAGSFVPSREELCKRECAAKGKLGRLVNRYPSFISQGKVPKICECSV